MVTLTYDNSTSKHSRLACRLARHICCNPPSVVETLRNTITSMLDNIIGNPEEVKYRSLRESNALAQSKLLSAHGAREILHLLGFEKIADPASTSPALAQYFLANVDTGRLSEAKTWVVKQCDEALMMEGAQTQGSTACADCVVHIQLSSGQTLEGGFGKHEQLNALYEFVRSSVLNPEEVLLLACAGRGKITNDMLGTTIEAAGFIPRVKLVVVKNTVPVMSQDELLRKKLQEGLESRKELNLVKEMHAKQKKESDDYRKMIIQEFQDDRMRQHSRGITSSKHAVELSEGFEEAKGRSLGNV